MHQIKISKRAQKSLDKLDKRYKKRVMKAITWLSINPYIGKPLEGEFKGCYSVRVWPYRIIYSIKKQKLIVHVLYIGHRQGVYG